ncbi:MAG: site-specific integrase [Pseudomonadota bacterium]
MTERERLSKRVVDAADPRSESYVIWDLELSGFGLKVHPTGRKTYVLKYRVGGGRQGRRREPVIGQHGALTPDQARKVAQEWLRDVALGLDPAAEREASRKAPSIGDVLKRYLKEHAEPHKKPSSIRNDKRIIENTLIPEFGKLKIRDFSRQDIGKLHGKLKDTPYEANRTLALMSKVCNLAEIWGLRTDGSNPCRHIKRYREHRRERLLSEQELAKLGSVLRSANLGPIRDVDGEEKLINPAAVAALRLLLFTGARAGEVLSMKWAWINWRKGRAELPDSKTGQKFVYLPAPAIAVLSELQQQGPDDVYVIKGKYPATHLTNLKNSWDTIRRVAGLEDVRVHDLRHCFASVGAMQGMSLPLIGALLGHRDIATTHRYAHLRDDPVRSASDRIASEVEALLNREVSQIKRAGVVVEPLR